VLKSTVLRLRHEPNGSHKWLYIVVHTMIDRNNKDQITNLIVLAMFSGDRLAVIFQKPFEMPAADVHRYESQRDAQCVLQAS